MRTVEDEEKLATREEVVVAETRVLESKDQANHADLFFAWNRVDKTY
jgi:hypothetical protein